MVYNHQIKSILTGLNANECYAARAEDLEHIYYQELYDIKYDEGW